MTIKDHKSLQDSKILLVEDDKIIRLTVSESLKGEGFQVLTFKDGLSASDFICDNTRNDVDLIILDLMLPGLNGLELCRKIRNEENYTPILILSAKDNESDRVLGLEVGADDYLTKPFGLNELIARSRALIRRSKRNKKSLEIIKKNLSELNLIDFYDFWLCEEIGFENENIRKLNLKESLPSDVSSLNIVILTKTKKNYSNNKLPLFGISDHIFKTFDDRPNLLTKREVRVQILADLELPKNGVIWDIGAGCGSIGLEALKLRPNLDLFCFDKRIGSKALILENSKRLGVKPKFIFEEDINSTLNTKNLSSFEKPNRLVIGGCDKKTKLQIIYKLAQSMSIGDIIVIPIIDIHSIKELKEELEYKNFKTNLNLIQTYKSLSISEGLRLEPNNPIFILKGKK